MEVELFIIIARDRHIWMEAQGLITLGSTHLVSDEMVFKPHQDDESFDPTRRRRHA